MMVASEAALNWIRTRVKNVTAINARSLGTETPQDYTFRYLEISNVNGRGLVSEEAISEMTLEEAPSRARRVVQDGDTVISSVRPNLQAAAFIRKTGGNLVASTGFFVVSPLRHKLDDKFTYYALVADESRQRFEAAAKGVGYPAVDDKDFSTLNLNLPPLSEQRQIAAYLDNACVAIDGAIRAKRRQLEVLDDLRKSIIHKAVTRGLDEQVVLAESGIEWVEKKPLHWRTCRIKEVCDFFNTVRVPLSAEERGQMTEKVFDYYGASGVIDKVESYLFDGTYILIAEDGANLLRRSSPLAFIASGKFWVNNHAHILRPRFGDMEYFVHLLESLDYSLYVTGSAQPKLTKENLEMFKIIVPSSINEQKQISAFLRNKNEEIQTLKNNLGGQISALEQYRKSLIHECVTGKRRITEADLAVV